MSSFDFGLNELLFNRYRAKEKLGGDAFSAFWLAYDEKGRRDVMIHFLPDFIKEDEKAILDLRRAGWQICELRHPHVGRCYELLEDGEFTAIVSEQLEGNSLKEIREAQPGQRFEISEIRELLRQTLAALQYTHATHQIPHGALTPSDIHVTETGQVKLLGFQTPALLFDALVRKGFDEWDATAVPYYSPQRWSSDEPNFLDDIYAVGAIVYELLTGGLPFVKDGELNHKDDIASMESRLQSRGIEHEPIPEEWEIAIAACLKLDPEQRPQSIAELAWRLGIDIESESAVTVQKIQMPAPSRKIREEEFESIAPDGEEEPETELALPKSLIYFVVTLLLLGVGIVGVIEWRNGKIAKREQEKTQPVVRNTITPVTADTETPQDNEETEEPQPELAALDLEFAAFPHDAEINAMVQQPDGKLIVAGNLNRTGESNGIIRLNADGTVDEGFQLGSATNPFNGEIHSIARQRDGKVIVAGDFENVSGVKRTSLARLNSDGSLDRSFNVQADGVVLAVTVLLNGKILIGGEFTEINGQPFAHLTRLNSDSSVDETFTQSGRPDGTIRTITILENSQIMIAGDFKNYGTVTRNSMARLNSDGELDLTFAVGSGADGAINSVIETGDGKLLVAGDFQQFNGQPNNRIARLLPNGRLDSTFSNNGGADGEIHDVLLREDGRILIAGAFTSYSGQQRNHLALLNANGSLNTKFDIGSGFDSDVHALIQSDGYQLVVGGAFHSVNEVTERPSLLRLDLRNAGAFASQVDRAALFGVSQSSSSLEIDENFNPGSGANATIHSVALQFDEKIIVGGEFSIFNNLPRSGLARLNTDGSLDNSFVSPADLNGTVYDVEIQPDGKVLIGGEFSFSDQPELLNLARLSGDGSLDPEFQMTTSPDGAVFDIVLQNDGQILIGGAFDRVSEKSRKGIARLSSTGGLDESFDPVLGADQPVYAIHIFPDETILIGGEFQRYNRFVRPYLARLNPNGSIVTIFRTDTSLDFPVHSILVDRENRILLAGGIDDENPQANILRLMPDGSRDTSFNPGGGANRAIYKLALTYDQAIYAGGTFESFNRSLRQSFLSLASNGSVDASIDPGDWLIGGVRDLVIQPDGKILFVGDFSPETGAAGNRILRLQIETLR